MVWYSLALPDPFQLISSFSIPYPLFKRTLHFSIVNGTGCAALNRLQDSSEHTAVYGDVSADWDAAGCAATHGPLRPFLTAYCRMGLITLAPSDWASTVLLP